MTTSHLFRSISLVAFAICLLPLTASAQRPQGIHALTILHDDGTITVSTRKPQDRNMEQLTYDVDGVLKMKRMFALDRIGQAQSGVVFDGAGNLVFTIKYKFDEFDRISEEQIMDREGKLVRLQLTEYDALGKATTKAINNPKMAGTLDETLLQHPDRLESAGQAFQGDQRAALQRSKKKDR